LAGDNDLADGKENTGRIQAEKAAKAVDGWVTLPPVRHKADWDMRHKYGALLPDGGVSTLSGLQNYAIHRPDKRSAFRHYTLDYIL
ncbi:hypothetical protein ONR49_25270, partial [Salmonella enterica subsp. enterica serovar Virginia]|nr:hypothetical protein [Salmonella enterica subsp. enterica serovar Virginia]